MDYQVRKITAVESPAIKEVRVTMDLQFKGGINATFRSTAETETEAREMIFDLLDDH